MPKKNLPGMIQDVDLRRLRVFRAVVERGGITAAESELNIGRSTISIHISELEKRLNLKLFDRGVKGFQPTFEGEQLYKSSLQLVNSLNEFREQLAAVKDGLGGELKLGYIDQLTSHPDFHIVEALKQFHNIAPKVRTSLEIAPMDRIERWVMNGKIDIGIVVANRELSGVSYKNYITEEQGLYCGEGHPLYRKPHSDIKWQHVDACERVGQQYIKNSNKENVRRHFNARPSALAHSAEALAHHILTGHFIGALPVHYAAQWVQKGQMKRLLPDKFAPTREIKIIRKKGAGSENICLLFLDTLFQVAKQLPGNGSL